MHASLNECYESNCYYIVCNSVEEEKMIFVGVEIKFYEINFVKYVWNKSQHKNLKNLWNKFLFYYVHLRLLSSHQCLNVAL